MLCNDTEIISKRNNKKSIKVFLGGTCNHTTWREELIKLLKIDYFNPIVPNWTEECYQKELEEKENDDYILFVITPKMTGAYSIAEVVDMSNKHPEKTIFYYTKDDGNSHFDKSQCDSLDKVAEMINTNGGKVFGCNCTIKDIADYLNSKGV